jgi:hypothetical protein
MFSIKKNFRKEMRGFSLSRHYIHRSSQISAPATWENYQPQTMLVEARIYG